MTNWLVCALEKWRNMSSPPLPLANSGRVSGGVVGATVFVQSSARKVREWAGLSTVRLSPTESNHLSSIKSPPGFYLTGDNIFCLSLTLLPSLCCSLVKFFFFFFIFCDLLFVQMLDRQLGWCSSKWLMVRPLVILRQAGEYVHFAWFPTSIFQTSPKSKGVFGRELGDGGWHSLKRVPARRGDTNGRVGPDDTITLFSMNTSANMFGGDGWWGVAVAVWWWGGEGVGRHWGFCVRWDGVNGQIGSRLHVSSSGFHAGWIYGVEACWNPPRAPRPHTVNQHVNLLSVESSRLVPSLLSFFFFIFFLLLFCCTFLFLRFLLLKDFE